MMETMFSSQTKARVINMRLTLATAQKGNQSVAKYVAKIKTLGDEMVAMGRHLEDEKLVSTSSPTSTVTSSPSSRSPLLGQSWCP